MIELNLLVLARNDERLVDRKQDDENPEKKHCPDLYRL
jgi:hypothetical protein